jgi:hypothetical protein
VPADRVELIVRFGSARGGAGEGSSGSLLARRSSYTGKQHTQRAIVAAARTSHAKAHLRSVQETLWQTAHFPTVPRAHFMKLRQNSWPSVIAPQMRHRGEPQLSGLANQHPRDDSPHQPGAYLTLRCASDITCTVTTTSCHANTACMRALRTVNVLFNR